MAGSMPKLDEVVVMIVLAEIEADVAPARAVVIEFEATAVEAMDEAFATARDTKPDAASKIAVDELPLAAAMEGINIVAHNMRRSIAGVDEVAVGSTVDLAVW